MSDPITGTIPDNDEEPWGDELRALLTQLKTAGNKATADLLDRLTISGSLSDLPNKELARSNLGVYSRGEIDAVRQAVAYVATENDDSVSLLLAGAVTDPDPSDGKISIATNGGATVSVPHLVDGKIGEVLPPRLDPGKLRQPGITPFKYGATGDGIADDILACEQAVSEVSAAGGGVVDLGRHYISRPLVVNAKNVIIRGGTLLGNGLYVGKPAGAPEDLEIDVIGTAIQFPSIIAGRHGITLSRVGKVNFWGVRVNNADHAVHVETWAWNQHVRRVTFDPTCVFAGGNIGVFAEIFSPGSDYYGVGDMHIIGCQFSAFKTTIKMSGIDGLIISTITSFQAQNAERDRGIDLDYVRFVRIFGCNLFESGKELIRLAHFTMCQVYGNMLAWPGQLAPSSGILLEGGDVSGFSNSNSSVVDNTIQWATKHGIEMLLPTDAVGIHLNRIIETGSAAKYRVGLFNATDPAADRAARDAAMAAFEHFAVVTPGAARTSAIGNIATGQDPNTLDGTKFSFAHTGARDGNQDGRGYVHKTIKTQTLTSSATIDAARGIDSVTLNYSSATQVNVITKPSDPGSLLRIFAFNDKATILHSSGSVQLKGGVSAAMPEGGVLTLMLAANVWREVSRSW